MNPGKGSGIPPSRALSSGAVPMASMPRSPMPNSPPPLQGRRGERRMEPRCMPCGSQSHSAGPRPLRVSHTSRLQAGVTFDPACHREDSCDSVGEMRCFRCGLRSHWGVDCVKPYALSKKASMHPRSQWEIPSRCLNIEGCA